MAFLKDLFRTVLLVGVISGCGTALGRAPTATMTPTPSPTPEPLSAVVEGSNLIVRQANADDGMLASGGVIDARLSPDGEHVAFTRGTQGFPNTLWVIRVDGLDARELVSRDDLVSSGGRPRVLDFEWLNNESILFTTAQVYDTGDVNDDNLYRASLDGTVSLMLPPGSGGEFAVSPNQQWIGVVTPGEQGLRGGVVRMVPPDAGLINEMLIYDEPGSSADPVFYPPIRWRENVMVMRLFEVLPEGETRYVCWEIPEPVLVGTETPGVRIRGYARASDLTEDFC